MNTRQAACAMLALAFTLGSCADIPDGPTAPRGLRADAPVTAAAVSPLVRFSEIHYDNDSTDVGEAIEVEGPAGTNVTGWSIVLYDQTGAMYGSTVLVGTFADQCEGRGTRVVRYPTDGIQNGGRDGMALVDAAGSVIEFLSWEGELTATDGPATGMTSVDLGVFESSRTPVGRSLQRRTDGLSWAIAAPHSFGACFGQPPIESEEPEIHPPSAALDGPYAAWALDPVPMSATASTAGQGDTLTYTWDLGDGNAATGARVTHTYAAAGAYTVRLIVRDMLGLVDTAFTTATMTNMPPSIAIARTKAMIDGLAESGAIAGGNATALSSKLDAAAKQVDNGNEAAATGQLSAALNQLDALVRSGRLTESDAASIRAMLQRAIDGL